MVRSCWLPISCFLTLNKLIERTIDWLIHSTVARVNCCCCCCWCCCCCSCCCCCTCEFKAMKCLTCHLSTKCELMLSIRDPRSVIRDTTIHDWGHLTRIRIRILKSTSCCCCFCCCCFCCCWTRARIRIVKSLTAEWERRNGGTSVHPMDACWEWDVAAATADGDAHQSPCHLRRSRPAAAASASKFSIAFISVCVSIFIHMHRPQCVGTQRVGQWQHSFPLQWDEWVRLTLLTAWMRFSTISLNILSTKKSKVL